MTFAQVVEIDGGFAIEFVNNLDQHLGYFTKAPGVTKVWRHKEQAERVLRSDKYSWWVKD